MIFKEVLLAKVLDGTKTMTRRSATGRRYHVGRDYAVQPGRGKFAVARVRVTGTRTEFLGDISYPDALREGFRSTVQFASYWFDLYGDFNQSERVQVIEFELVAPEDVA